MILNDLLLASLGGLISTAYAIIGFDSYKSVKPEIPHLISNFILGFGFTLFGVEVFRTIYDHPTFWALTFPLVGHERAINIVASFIRKITNGKNNS